jgi:hypothetical protein
MSCKKPASRPRFQQGINPYTGRNERDFKAGNYIHDEVKALVRSTLEAVLVPAGYTLDFMDFWFFPRDAADAIVRLRITPPASAQEQHDVRVKNEGDRPWAGVVGPTLVVWVKDRYSL